MALADITLNDGQGTPVAHTFTYIGTANGRVTRNDFSADTQAPLTMTHAHNTKSVKGVVVDSHLLRFDSTELDGDGTPYSTNIRLMADMPKAVFTDALADDFAAYIRNWATSANVRAWLRGSVG